MSLQEAYSKSLDLKPYSCEGVPEGYCFIRDGNKNSVPGTKLFYLIALKPGNEEMVSMKPVVYRADASEEDIAKEYKQAEKNLLEIYKDLKNE